MSSVKLHSDSDCVKRNVSLSKGGLSKEDKKWVNARQDQDHNHRDIRLRSVRCASTALGHDIGELRESYMR